MNGLSLTGKMKQSRVRLCVPHPKVLSARKENGHEGEGYLPAGDTTSDVVLPTVSFTGYIGR
jgi:hypothetical protein